MTASSPKRHVKKEPVIAPRRWLERLKINRFRSVAPGTELTFSDGMHVVLGKNATGKSTLLDLVGSAVALDFDHPRFQGELLDLEITLTAGPYQIDAAVKRSAQPARSGRAARKQESPPAVLEEGRYTFRGPSGFAVTVVLSNEDIPRRSVSGVDPVPYGLERPLGRSHRPPPLAPGRSNLHNLWFDGSSYKFPALGSLIGEGAFSVGSADQVLHRVPESDELMQAIEGEDFEICLGPSGQSRPYLLPKRIFKALPTDGSAINVSLSDQPVIGAFVREMGFSEARMFLGPPRVEQRFGRETFVYAAPTFTFYRDGRLARRGDQLSYGQRRLFALGWYLMCNRDIAIFDEPANGLHESWVEFLVSQLHDRQVFLTGQNREMLDMLPFGTETEIRRGFILCESRPDPDGGEPTLHWRGLREEESSLMIKALSTSRLDLVTDLLRALNLW